MFSFLCTKWPNVGCNFDFCTFLCLGGGHTFQNNPLSSSCSPVEESLKGDRAYIYALSPSKREVCDPCVEGQLLVECERTALKRKSYYQWLAMCIIT
jgi:hypothetical protein